MFFCNVLLLFLLFMSTNQIILKCQKYKVPVQNFDNTSKCFLVQFLKLMQKHYFVTFVTKQFHQINAFKFQVTQHLCIAKISVIQQEKKKIKQIFIKDSFVIQNSEFSLDLWRAFLAFDIPWWEFHSTNFNPFLQKYTGVHIPGQSSVRINVYQFFTTK